MKKLFLAIIILCIALTCASCDNKSFKASTVLLSRNNLSSNIEDIVIQFDTEFIEKLSKFSGYITELVANNNSDNFI